VSETARRHEKGPDEAGEAKEAEEEKEAPSLGTVIVSLQRTPHDASATLRLFAPLDRVFAMLAEEMGTAGELPADLLAAALLQPSAKADA
jgi:hypothetical protein